MCASVNVERKEMDHGKPSQSVGKIAGEILAGIATGLALASPVAIAAGIVLIDDSSMFAWIVDLFIFAFVFPLYGSACAIGVYLVGNRGEQRSSFSMTLIWSLFGVVVSGIVLVGPGLLLVTTKGGPIALLAIALLTPPIFATIGFDLRRRYKEPSLP